MDEGKANRLAKAAKRAARQHIKHLAAANSSSSHYLRNVEWIVETMALGCADIAVGVILIIVLTGLKIYAMWPLLAYGVVFVAARWMILLLCPIILKLTVPIVIIINALLVAFVVIVDTAITALDAYMMYLNEIITVINDLDKVFTGHKLTNFSFTLVKWIKIKTITYTEFANTIKALPPTCANFDSMPKILSFFMKYGLHSYTCPMVRFLWPLPSFYDMLEGVLGWSYYGDAMPNVFKDGANCVADESITVYDSICASMGIGYLFIEFFFPALILFIVVFTIGAGVLRLLRASSYTLYLGTEALVSAVVLLLDIVTV
jgi:hypothetical protein